MSVGDPGAATGQQPTELPGRCECGHPVGVHLVNDKHQRAKCAACDGTSVRLCGCRMYVTAEVVSRG